MSEVKNIFLDDAVPVEELRKKRIRALGYLSLVDFAESIKLGEEWGILSSEMPTPKLETPEDCLSCLEAFADGGIWLGHLFNHGEIWGIYMKSIAEERFHVPLGLVMSLGGPADLMLYLRATYRFGYQVIPDQEYDSLERLYLATYPNLAFLNEHTNDDDVYTAVVKDAIKMSGTRGARETAPKKAPVDGSYAVLNSEKSTSIRPVRSYQEVYDYLLSAQICPTHWSLKMDGFNTKVLCKEDGGGIDVALSRGRSTDSWDYTEALKRVFEVNGWDAGKLSGKLTGESMVDPVALDYLRSKYPGKDYKSPKSTAGAMLRAPQKFDVADYKFLHFYPFEYGEWTKDVAFTKLAEVGLEVPPSVVIPAGGVPLDSLEEFSNWLDSTVLDPIWKRAEEDHIGRGGSDGVVLQLLSNVENDRADKFSDLNVALKFSHWTEADYESVVTNIIFEQRRVEMSVVLEIEPVVTRDLNVATRVSIGSPAILVNDGVQVGDTIAFARKSEAINIYLGKR